MKVALLLYGQPRFVDRHDVWCSHRDSIMSVYETDVYAQMWYDQKGSYEKLSSWAAEKSRFEYPSIPISAPDIIQKQYEPVSMLIQKPLKVEFDPEVEELMLERFTGNQFFSMDNMKNIVSQVTAIDNVCRLAYATEYDFYVLARYDAVLENFPDLNSLEQGKFYLPHGGHFNDLVHVFSKDFLLSGDSNPFAYLGWEICNEFWLHLQVEEPIPELYKYHYFMESDYAASLTKIGMYAHVIRS